METFPPISCHRCSATVPSIDDDLAHWVVIYASEDGDIWACPECQMPQETRRALEISRGLDEPGEALP